MNKVMRNGLNQVPSTPLSGIITLMASAFSKLAGGYVGIRSW